MKKIAFAWLTYWYDFSTEEEAKEFIRNNRGKYWNFGEVYENHNGEGCLPYTVEVKKPYGKYNPGW